MQGFVVVIKTENQESPSEKGLGWIFNTMHQRKLAGLSNGAYGH
jgi:hypothetical protein